MPASASDRRQFAGLSSLLRREAELWDLPVRTVALLALLPVAIVGCTVLAGAIDKELFRWITAEDRVGEWVQFFCFAGSAMVGVWLVRLLARRGLRWTTALYALGVVGLCFVAGEEISWGQGLFGWSTPEELTELNRQNETNVHNVPIIEQAFRVVKFGVGVWGVVLPIVLARTPSLRTRAPVLRHLVPPVGLGLYFLLPLCWRPFRTAWKFIYAEGGPYAFAVAEFSEVEELTASIGILLFLVFQLRMLRRAEHAPITKPPASAAASTLREVFAAVDGAGVRYAILRGADLIAAPHGDVEVDVLVREDDADTVAGVLGRLRFVELPAWGHAPHRFFIGYDADTGRWMKVDAVTDLRFGRVIRSLRAGHPAQVLARAYRRDGVLAPAAEDELVALLLHGILDKDGFSSRHRGRLAALAAELGNDVTGAGARRMRDALDELFESDQIVAIAEGRWDTLLRDRGSLVRRLLLRDPVGTLRREAWGRLLRRLRPVLRLFTPRGLRVALIAPDGAGKTTLASSLLAQQPLRARVVYMGTNPDAATVTLPFYDRFERSARLTRVTQPRQGWRRMAPKAFGFIARLAERWYRAAVAWYQAFRGRCVVFDRFVYDGSAGAPPPTGWKRVRRWLLDAPYPQPDLVVFLDAPADVLYARKPEHPPERLERQRAGYLELCRRLSRAVVVDAARPPDVVLRDVVTLIWQRLSARARAVGA